MQSKSAGKQPDKGATVRSRNLKGALILTAITSLLVIGLLYFIIPQNESSKTAGNEQNASSAGTASASPTADVNRLAGRWLRPDGGYILEIRSVSPDGKLDVGYFNPNPIHVGRAEWVKKDGKLYALVELQDVNYPGSTYGLEYIVSQDRLAGTYYQAQEKTTFDVQFVREK